MMSAPGGLGSSSGIFRRKPIDQIQDKGEGGLNRTLGLWQLTAIGVGGIIGAGIFTLAGTVANGTAGAAGPLSFLLPRGAGAGGGPSFARVAGGLPQNRAGHTDGEAGLRAVARRVFW